MADEPRHTLGTPTVDPLFARERELILDSLVEGVYGLDLQGRTTFINKAAAELLGWDADDLVGRPQHDVLHHHRADGSEYPVEECPIHAAFTAGRTQFVDDEVFWRKDGESFPVEYTSSPLRDASGTVVGAVVVFRDVSERQRLEAELRERNTELRRNEAKFRGIFNQTYQFIGLMTTDGILTDANRSALKAAGIPPNTVLGKPFWETVWWSHSEELQEQLRGATRRAAEGEFVRFEATHPTPDGSIIHVDFSLQPVRDENGEVLFLIPEGRDITALKETELALAERTRELERSNEDLNQFAYVASHDLRAPLRGITSLAEWIIEDTGEKLPDESREHLVRIQQQCARMTGLLNGLLEYSRAGRKTFKIESVDTGALLEDVVLMLQPPDGFRVEWPDDMPTLRVERSPLHRVFLNLVGNAIKHHDGPPGHVRIDVRDAGDRVAFTVTDDGPGIAPEFHASVFEMFRTLKPRDVVEGSGMGLAIVSRLVEHHGGRMTLESAVGEGATFGFTWPREIVRESAPASA